MRRGFSWGWRRCCWPARPALAEERTRSYGGSGADRLTRLIEYGDGLIAVGRTDSRNGDLAMRTRHNQAGWMLCLNSEGAPLWSYCTAKDGRKRDERPLCARKRADFAVLTGRGIDGAGMLIVSGEGRLAQRRTAPAVETVCAHGSTDMIGVLRPRRRAASGVDCRARDGALLRRGSDADGAACPRRVDSKGTAGFAPCVDGSRLRLGGLRGRGRPRRCWSRPERTTRR